MYLGDQKGLLSDIYRLLLYHFKLSSNNMIQLLQHEEILRLVLRCIFVFQLSQQAVIISLKLLTVWYL
jgi:hypothetical protein